MEGVNRGLVPLDIAEHTSAIDPADPPPLADARHKEISDLAEKLLSIANRLRQLENASPSARTAGPSIRTLSEADGDLIAIAKAQRSGDADGSASCLDRRKAGRPWTESPPHLHPTPPQHQAHDPQDSFGVTPAAENTPGRNLKAAREAYTIRRSRNRIFENAEIFGEPAWDILLDLYVALGEGKPVSVSSACIGSAAPPTTGLRWLGILSDLGLILREHDPEDQRRVLVRLSDKGLSAMDTYFSNATADG